MTTSYDVDFIGWTQGQAALIRALPAGSGLDTENLAEEIEAAGRIAIRDLSAHMRITLTNLITLAHSAGVIGSPQEAISAQTDANVKGEQGVFRHVDLQRAWKLAERAAELDLKAHGYELPKLHETCPMTVEQLLADDFDVNAAVQALR